MKILGIVLIIVVVLLLVFFIGTAFYVSKPKVATLEFAYDYDNKKGFFKDYDNWVKEDYVVKSYDGYEIHCQYLPNPKESKKTVILLHGYTSNRYGMIKYSHIYRDRGYNCLIYDHRSHGANKHGKVTFGKRESKDFMEVLKDLKERYNPGIIGLHGESMGSATEINALQYKPEINFIVNDCGYADLGDVLEGQMKNNFHLPKGLTKIVSVFNKLLFGFSYYEIRPIDQLQYSTVPVCYMHGAKDSFINKNHSERMYEKTKGYKEIHIFEGSEHAQSFENHKEEYRNIVNNFLDKINM